MATATNQKELRLTAIVLGIFQILMIVLYGNVTQEAFIESGDDGAPQDHFGKVYHMFIGVEIMIFFGFGYLMTFMSRYGVGAVGFTMMIGVIGIQYGMLVEGFFKNMYTNKWHDVHIDMLSFMDSMHLTAAVLISFGALIGKVGSLQLVALTLLEGFFYALNKKMLMFDAVLDLLDAGGTISIHMFGAFFGLAAALVVGKPPAGKAPAATYVADVFSLVGTIFLWIYWPSFNGGALEPDSQAQQRAIHNTILGLCASTVGTFVTSILCHPHGKLRPVDLQNATLAGGVALGAVCHMTLNFSGTLLIGFVGGVASTFGFAVIQPILEDKGLHDSCGVLNLHGIPALVGGVASVILAAAKGASGSDQELLEHDGAQWQHQLFAILITLGVSIVAGLLTGFILKSLGKFQSFEYFDDSSFWEHAEEEGELVAATPRVEPDQGMGEEKGLLMVGNESDSVSKKVHPVGFEGS